MPVKFKRVHFYHRQDGLCDLSRCKNESEVLLNAGVTRYNPGRDIDVCMPCYEKLLEDGGNSGETTKSLRERANTYRKARGDEPLLGPPTTEPHLDVRTSTKDRVKAARVEVRDQKKGTEGFRTNTRIKLTPQQPKEGYPKKEKKRQEARVNPKQKRRTKNVPPDQPMRTPEEVERLPPVKETIQGKSFDEIKQVMIEEHVPKAKLNKWLWKVREYQKSGEENHMTKMGLRGTAYWLIEGARRRSLGHMDSRVPGQRNYRIRVPIKSHRRKRHEGWEDVEVE